MPEMERQLKLRRLGMEAAYLAACALGDQVPQMDETVNLEDLYRFCKFHSITSIVAMALEPVWKDAPADPEIMQKWRQARDKAIRKNVLLNAERERILQHLESIGCWYMPLKGSLLQFDYPKFGMRQMSDNDLLCDPEKSIEIRDFMQKSGYTCEQFHQGHHDEYNREPVYNFEIHRSLFKPEEAPVLAGYYEDIHERSLKDEDHAYGYHLSLSDFYIYLTVHALNHFQESGIGIRHLMDVFVFLGKYSNALDREYVDRELESLSALEFERWCAGVSEKLFRSPTRHPEIAGDDLNLLDAFFASGAHGTEAQLFRKAYEKFSSKKGNSKFRYFLNRMFPNSRLLGVAYPIVKKHKWLVPFVWIYRLLRSVFSRPGRVIRETRDLMKKRNP